MARLSAILIAVLLASPFFAFAQLNRSAGVKQNRAFIYHGKIVRPNGSVPTGSLLMTFKLYSPEPTLCLLWSETQTVAVNNGGFSAELGHEVNRNSGPEGGAASDFKQVFINNPGLTIPNAQCASGASYIPGVDHDRLLSTSIIDAGNNQVRPIRAASGRNRRVWDCESCEDQWSKQRHFHASRN